jgi:hypothetical protein
MSRYDALAKHYIDNKIKIDLVAGIESRGFVSSVGHTFIPYYYDMGRYSAQL